MTCVLNHCGWVTHFCISKLTIIGSDNGLSPGRHQAIIWTNAGISLLWTFGTNIIHFYSRKCIWKCRLRNGRMDELVSERKQAWYSWSNTVIFVCDQATGIPWTVWKHYAEKYFMTSEWYSFKFTDPFILTILVYYTHDILTHCGLVMPYLHGDKDLHQHWFRLLMVSSQYFNFDFSFMSNFIVSARAAILCDVVENYALKLLLDLPGANELSIWKVIWSGFISCCNILYLVLIHHCCVYCRWLVLWYCQTACFVGLSFKVLRFSETSVSRALIARFMGPKSGPSGADKTQVGPMLAPWTLLSEV